MDKLMLQTALNFLCDSPDVWSTSSSEDEEYHHNQHKDDIVCNNTSKADSYVGITVSGYSEHEFQQHFRVNRQIAYKLIDRLEGSGRMASYSSGRQSISSEKAFLITLWYLGNTDTFREISTRFSVSYSTVYSMLRKVVKFILTLRSEYIKWPSFDQYRAIADKFKEIGGLDNVIGAIDACHVKRNSPLLNKSKYKNRRGYYSLLFQGVCTADNIFTDIYCGEPGSLYDAAQLTNSGLYERATKNTDYFGEFYLVGDSAYPDLTWLIPPFEESDELTEQTREFNMRHRTSQIVIENAFGLLKGRFRKLFGGFRNLDLRLGSECIMAACILHNVCILEGDDLDIEIVDLGDQLQSDVYIEM